LTVPIEAEHENGGHDGTVRGNLGLESKTLLLTPWTAKTWKQ